MARRPPNPRNPLGAGMVGRRLRIAARDMVRLGSLLAGYDELVSVHGDERDGMLLATTASRARELDDVLDGLRGLIAFDVVAHE